MNTLKVIFESHLSILFKFLKYIIKGTEWNNTIFAEFNNYDELNLNNIFLSAETIDEYYIELNRNHYQLLLNSESSASLSLLPSISIPSSYINIGSIIGLNSKYTNAFSTNITGVVYNIEKKIINSQDLMTFFLVDINDLTTVIHVDCWKLINVKQFDIIYLNNIIIKKSLPLKILINNLSVCIVDKKFLQPINEKKFNNITTLSQPKKNINFLKDINKSELHYMYTMPARLLNAISQNNFIKLSFIDNNKTGFYINLWELGKLKPLINGIDH